MLVASGVVDVHAVDDGDDRVIDRNEGVVESHRGLAAAFVRDELAVAGHARRVGGDDRLPFRLQGLVERLHDEHRHAFESLAVTTQGTT